MKILKQLKKLLKNILKYFFLYIFITLPTAFFEIFSQVMIDSIIGVVVLLIFVEPFVDILNLSDTNPVLFLLLAMVVGRAFMLLKILVNDNSRDEKNRVEPKYYPHDLNKNLN
jgi:hypothetical protein